MGPATLAECRQYPGRSRYRRWRTPTGSPLSRSADRRPRHFPFGVRSVAEDVIDDGQSIVDSGGRVGGHQAADFALHGCKFPRATDGPSDGDGGESRTRLVRNDAGVAEKLVAVFQQINAVHVPGAAIACVVGQTTDPLFF